MIQDILKTDCPHCYTRNVAFSFVYRHKVSDVKQHNIYACGYCNQAVIFEYTKKEDNDKFVLVQTFPEGAVIELPLYLPKNIESFFLQGIKALPDSPDAAGAMFRKTLENALNDVVPKELRDKSIFIKIRDAVRHNYISDELGKWADIIRIDGNEAAHAENPFDLDQAEVLRQFTEIFLTQIYTLPALVAKRSKTSKKYHGKPTRFTSKRR
ncbi:MAG: DUF4145 domain-containing protein [Alphaproteobacteria bacterium]